MGSRLELLTGVEKYNMNENYADRLVWESKQHLHEHLPVFALPDDSVVEIQREPVGVHKAVEMVPSHLRKFLVDRSMQMPNAQPNQNKPPVGPTQSWAALSFSFPRSVGGGSGFGTNIRYMPPPRQFDYYFPPVDMSPLEK
ncbi:hypothetical protein HAX54_044264 [Datura stramonium]|uniref:Uncharacterized protein n=1 Tax=Datura stramonium TaxID=4076 RepID=A0ABS8W5W7_DATST|nr:hypothetical protein [Datura stramonium]